MDVGGRFGDELGKLRGVGDYGVGYEEYVGKDESEENRNQWYDGLLYATEIHKSEYADSGEGAFEFVMGQVFGQETEKGVCAGSDGDRDSEDVVDKECATGDHA